MAFLSLLHVQFGSCEYCNSMVGSPLSAGNVSNALRQLCLVSGLLLLRMKTGSDPGGGGGAKGAEAPPPPPS